MKDLTIQVKVDKFLPRTDRYIFIIDRYYDCEIHFELLELGQTNVLDVNLYSVVYRDFDFHHLRNKLTLGMDITIHGCDQTTGEMILEGTGDIISISNPELIDWTSTFNTYNG